MDSETETAAPLVLTTEESDLLRQLVQQMAEEAKADERHEAYARGSQQLRHIGIALPPDVRNVESALNIPRVVINEVARRIQIRYACLPGELKANDDLQLLLDSNNFASEMPVFLNCLLTYGRVFTSVSTSADPEGLPTIRVESPRDLTCIVDNRSRQMTAALRVYVNVDPLGVKSKRFGTLYLPGSTISLESSGAGQVASTAAGWTVTDRDDHGFGRIPLVLHLNRRRIGEWVGETEITDVIPITDDVARTLTNRNLAGEVAAIPDKIIVGVDESELTEPVFDDSGNPVLDEDGEPKTRPKSQWSSWWDHIKAYADKDVKWGQFDAADLSQFQKVINDALLHAAFLTGLPARYFSASSANPASEGSIRADESRMVSNIEEKQRTLADSLGWTLALAYELWQNVGVDGNRCTVIFFDPSTPTFAERADGLSKLNGGIPIVSRRSSMELMGMTDAQIELEIERLQEESEMDDLGLWTAKQAMLAETQANAGDSGALIAALLDHLGLTAEDLTGGAPPTAA